MSFNLSVLSLISKNSRVLLHNESRQFTILFLTLLLIAIVGQWLTGVYRADLSQFPDAGSHYINGLLIHDYIIEGFPSNPLDYALRYYVHYPRVSIGQWPPLYYMVQAAVYFITGPSIQTALVLQAVFAAAVAAIVGWVISRFAGWVVGLLASLATLLAPEIFVGVQDIMLDLQIAFFTCLAMLAWACFLADETWPWSLAFAMAAVAAIMTKGSGFFLALVPPLSVVLTGRLRLLSNWRFWLPAPIAAVLILPWYLVTYKIAAGDLVYSWDYIVTAGTSYSSMLLDQLGAIGILFATLGVFSVFRDREWHWRHTLGISAICVVSTVFVFHCIVPTGNAGRYLAPLVSPLVILAYFGVESIVRSRLRRMETLVMALCFLAILAVEYRFPPKTSLAMNAVSNMILAVPAVEPFILIGSTTAGEGALTAEVATRDRGRQRYVVRGFNVLASGDFNGTDYRPRFAGPDDLAKWIEREGINWVVIDTSPSSLSWTHNAQLLEVARSNRERWKLAGRFPNSKGETLLYEVSVFDMPKDRTSLLSEIAPSKKLWR